MGGTKRERSERKNAQSAYRSAERSEAVKSVRQTRPYHARGACGILSLQSGVVATVSRCLFWYDAMLQLNCPQYFACYRGRSFHHTRHTVGIARTEIYSSPLSFDLYPCVRVRTMWTLLARTLVASLVPHHDGCLTGQLPSP